jgi:hypothetical protein
MPNLVCSGAQLSCSFGTSPATFTASEESVDATGAAGVVTDVSPSNVPTFGMCTTTGNPQVASATTANSGTLTPQPCAPVLSPWTPGSSGVTIGGVPALDDSSQCNCTWGGVITVSSAGQESAQVD